MRGWDGSGLAQGERSQGPAAMPSGSRRIATVLASLSRVAATLTPLHDGSDAVLEWLRGL
jgi:hypothetical protein